MTELKRSALLPYSAQQLYQLINDVEAYPQYMEGCVGAEILHRADDVIEARLDLAKAGLHYSLVTRNTMLPPHRVDMALVDGPFQQFSGCWRLLPLADSACKVSLDMHFTLASKVLTVATRALFNPLADNLVDALVLRAHQLYR